MAQAKHSKLKQHMKKGQRTRLKTDSTSHAHCMRATGVARPGKTARDRAKGKAKEKV